MKCQHCSAPVAPSDWFCPNCKRSLPRARRKKPAAALAAFSGLTVLVLGAAAFQHAPHGRLRAPLLVTETVFGASDAGALPAAAALPGVAVDDDAPAPPGRLTIVTDPPVRTFVYLNDGRLLGQTPLRAASVPAGRHTLVFWAPSIRGRSTRVVNVSPGAAATVIERLDR